MNTFDSQPATLSLGRANSRPRFEAAPRGPGRGARARFDLPGSEAFGDHQRSSCSASAAVLAQPGVAGTARAVGDVVQVPAPGGRGVLSPASCARSATTGWCWTSTIRWRRAADLRGPRDQGALMAVAELHEVLLAEPRGFCAGVDPRDRDRRARACRVRRADLRAPRDRAQHLRRRGPQGQRARSSSRTWPKCRPARPRLQCPRRSRRCAARLPSGFGCSMRPARW